MKKKSQFLYITRKFPPSIGGMERFNFKLSQYFKNEEDYQFISYGGGNRWLFFVLPWIFLKALWICCRQPIYCIYVSDGLLAPLGYILKCLTQKRVVCNIHGRDIALALWIYQLVVPWCLRRLDAIICVSEELKKECIQRKIDPRAITVIPNGVDLEDFSKPATEQQHQAIETKAATPLNGRNIMITVGRLVPKKGIHSFIENILPLIVKKCPNVLYLIAGDGPLKDTIQEEINDHQLQENARLLGKLDMNSGLTAALYNIADIFVMPNIPVKDDMEGFGIVAIEGGAAGIPVVASNVDGISQAIIHQKNGFLIEHTDYTQFAKTIIHLLNNKSDSHQFGAKAKQYVEEHYSWKTIAHRYLTIFKNSRNHLKNE